MGMRIIVFARVEGTKVVADYNPNPFSSSVAIEWSANSPVPIDANGRNARAYCDKRRRRKGKLEV
jgi:hypothetical protein